MLAVPDKLKPELPFHVYKELLEQMLTNKQVRVGFVAGSSIPLDPMNQTSCTMKGRRLPDSLPAVAHLWEDWNSRHSANYVQILLSLMAK